MIGGRWVVVLEVAATSTHQVMRREDLHALLEAMSDHEPSALFHPSRYALQLRVLSASPAAALSSAMSLWTEAVGAVDLPPWGLVRAEVLTHEEFEREVFSLDAYREGVHGPAGHEDPRPGEDLLRNVFTDALTGLASYELFLDQVRAALAASDPERSMAVLVTDIDDFARVNADAGHVVGDQVLRALAGRMAEAVPGAVATGRLGGNAFAMLIAERSAGAAESMAQRLVAELRTPLNADGRTVLVTASVGLAPASPGGSAEDLIAHAAVAVYAAKTAGGDCHRVFQPGLLPHRPRFVAEPLPDRMAQVVLLQGAALAANESPNLEAAASSVLQQVCALMGWTAGHLWLADGDVGMRATGVWNASARAGLQDFRRHIASTSYAIGEATPGRVLATGRPAWTDDVVGEGRIPEALAVDAGLEMACAFPVLVRQEVVAALEFFSDRAVPPDAALTDVMASVCSQLGRVVERARAEEALSRSEERYRLLVDSAPALMWMSGPDARCTFFNAPWLEFTGRTMEQEVGDGWVDGVHPDDRERCFEVYLAAFGRREAFEMEYRLRRADGEFLGVLDRGRPVGEGSAFSGYVGSCVDVTDMHLTDKQARDRAHRIRALVQDADVMIILLDANGTVTEEYAGRFDLGYEEGDGKGGFGPEYVGRAAAEFAEVLARPGPGRSFRCRVRHADGSWRWIETVANNLLDDPIVGGILVTVADVTSRKTAEDEVARSAAHLREAQALARTGSWWSDLRTGACYWSDELHRILGLLPGDISPSLEQLLTSVHPEDRAILAGPIGKERPIDPAVRARVVQPSGEIRHVVVRVAFAHDADGGPVRAFGTVHDLGREDGAVPDRRNGAGSVPAGHTVATVATGRRPRSVDTNPINR